MDGEYLASGFSRVDARADRGAYAICLELLDGLPHFRRYKRRSYALLGLEPGMCVLDVGCGLGDDAFRMAGKVGPAGCVVGVDLSVSLLARARRRPDGGRNVAFLAGDARRLPFPEGAFDRCRIDRTLQHIPSPEEAVREMARVLRPGGRLLAYDNDWGTFSLSASDVSVTRIIEDFWCDAFPNGWIGRRLKTLFLQAELGEVRVFPCVCVIGDFELADRVYDLRATVRRVVERGLLAPRQGERWVAELAGQSAAGCFQCALTAYLAVGRKSEAGKAAASPAGNG